MLDLIILPTTLKGNAHVHTPLSKGDSVPLSSCPVNATTLNEEHLLTYCSSVVSQTRAFSVWSREKNELYTKGSLSYYEFDEICSVVVRQEGIGHAQQHRLAPCAPCTGHQAGCSQQTCTRHAAAVVQQVWEQPVGLAPQWEGLFCFVPTVELHRDL